MSLYSQQIPLLQIGWVEEETQLVNRIETFHNALHPDNQVGAVGRPGGPLAPMPHRFRFLCKTGPSQRLFHQTQPGTARVDGFGKNLLRAASETELPQLRDAWLVLMLIKALGRLIRPLAELAGRMRWALRLLGASE